MSKYRANLSSFQNIGGGILTLDSKKKISEVLSSDVEEKWGKGVFIVIAEITAVNQFEKKLPWTLHRLEVTRRNRSLAQKLQILKIFIRQFSTNGKQNRQKIWVTWIHDI